MFAFSQAVSPVVQAHFDSKAAFFNDTSRSVTSSIQNIFQANVKLSQGMLEETISACRQVFGASGVKGALDGVSSQAQPASDRLHAYQQQLSRVAADSRVELARITQQHVQEASRTIHALSEEVTRVVAEESERNKQRQEEASKTLRKAFVGDGAAYNDNKGQPQPAQ
jgi:phasin family protein